MSWKIGLLGTGNVSSFWVAAFQNVPGCRIFVRGSNLKSTHAFVEEHRLERLEANTEVDFYLVSVQDKNIQSVLLELPKGVPIFISSALFNLQEANDPFCGVLYPLQTLRKESLPLVTEVPFLCEFSEKIRPLAEEIISKLKLKVYYTDYNQRLQAHTVAVFINNFGYLVMKMGVNLLKGIPQEVLYPLIQKTASNALINKDLQTGPAMREDKDTMNKHRELLNPEQRELYDFLSDYIRNHKAK